MRQRRASERDRKAPPPERTARPAAADSVLALQRAAGNQAVARLLQRSMTFSPETNYLDTDQGDGPFPSIYQAVQARAKQLVPNIEVRELTTASAGERAHYQFDRDHQQASIEVRKRKYAGDGDASEQQELSGLQIAMVHETQHALDDLEDTSALKHKVADHSTGGKLKGEDAALGPVMERMWSELNAHAVQSAQARELRTSGRKIPHSDAILADSYTMDDFEPPNGSMFKKLVTYAKLYTGGTSTELAEKQVIELLFLNWGDIQALVAKTERAPGRIGIQDPEDAIPQRPVESDEEEAEEIVVS